MMTEDERAEYALAQRLACRPLECTADPYCWVALGTKESLSERIQGTPRCAACSGKVRISEWRTPAGLQLAPHGRLNPRGHSRGPDGRRGELRPGEAGGSPKGAESFSPASGTL